MEQLVLVRAEAPGRFTAQAVYLPECRGEGATEADAVERVREALAARLASAKLLRVQVPVNGADNPWLDSFGRSAEDPDFQTYLEEMEKLRAADGGSQPADVPA
jgi:hypothetical protein